ncbi:MAG: DNA modification methylase [Microbacterium sp.]
MKTRSLASVALGAAVILGATGCGAITPQATTVQYSASDGVNVDLPDDAPVTVLNALLVTGEDSTDAGFIAALVNRTSDDQTVTISWDGGSAAIEVPGETTLSFGASEEPLLLQNVSSAPGASEEMVFQSGGTEAVAQKIQVFDEELEQFSGLAPTPAPSATVTTDESGSDEGATDDAEETPADTAEN